MRLKTIINMLPHMPRYVMATGGIINKSLGTRNMTVDDTTAKRK